MRLAKLTQKQKLENFKQEVRDSGYPTFESRHQWNDKLIGTMYIKETMDYGFHIYFIHEPDEHNQLAGVNGTITEMFYDLRNKVYWIKRNQKDVQFSERNVDTLFPSGTTDRIKLFKILSTEGNEGLYEYAFQELGCMGQEQISKFGRFFHRLITSYNHYELLYKAGFRNIRSLNIVNSNASSPREMLGLTKTQWKMMKKYNVQPSSMRKRGMDSALIDECDKKAINYLAYIRTLENEYGMDKIQNFVSREFNYIYGYHAYSSAIKTANEYNLPIKNFIRYIYFECDVSQGLEAGTAISQYSDYIRMTTEMGYERFDRYPKFLRTAHDIASRNYRIKLDAVQLEQWNKAYEENKEFATTLHNYKIVVPQEPTDLVREGNVLGHCVGSYVNKVRKQLSTILFLREAHDVEAPLVTIEVRGNSIVQARGKMNNPPTKEQKDAIKRFAKKFELKY